MAGSLPELQPWRPRHIDPDGSRAKLKPARWHTLDANELSEWRELHFLWPTPLISDLLSSQTPARERERERGSSVACCVSCGLLTKAALKMRRRHVLILRPQINSKVNTDSACCRDRLLHSLKAPIAKCSTYTCGNQTPTRLSKTCLDKSEKYMRFFNFFWFWLQYEREPLFLPRYGKNKNPPRSVRYWVISCLSEVDDL